MDYIIYTRSELGLLMSKEVFVIISRSYRKVIQNVSKNCCSEIHIPTIDII